MTRTTGKLEDSSRAIQAIEYGARTRHIQRLIASIWLPHRDQGPAARPQDLDRHGMIDGHVVDDHGARAVRTGDVDTLDIIDEDEKEPDSFERTWNRDRLSSSRSSS